MLTEKEEAENLLKAELEKLKEKISSLAEEKISLTRSFDTIKIELVLRTENLNAELKKVTETLDRQKLNYEYLLSKMRHEYEQQLNDQAVEIGILKQNELKLNQQNVAHIQKADQNRENEILLKTEIQFREFQLKEKTEQTRLLQLSCEELKDELRELENLFGSAINKMDGIQTDLVKKTNRLYAEINEAAERFATRFSEQEKLLKQQANEIENRNFVQARLSNDLSRSVEQVNLLTNKADELSTTIKWYEQTYVNRRLFGIIKDRWIKIFK